MAYPPKPDLDYSYTGFAQGLGDASFPGLEMDNSLANLKSSADSTIDFIKGSFNSDGTLKAIASPDGADFSAYINLAQTASEAAASQASAAAASATAASGSASSASTSASAAATSASNAASTLAGALVKSNNLSDLTNAATARSNLGLGTAATTAATAYATAAQGAKADTALQAVPAGSVVQVVVATLSAADTTTTQIPLDDTIPQSSEGKEILTASITPQSATNLLVVEGTATLNANGSCAGVIAGFVGAEASARGAGFALIASSGSAAQVSFRFTMTAGGTSAMTFRMRVGPSTAVTLTVNASAAGARLLGGIPITSLKITEVKA